MKTKKKKKEKKTIEACQIAKLRIIEEEIKKSNENLLDIDELDIILIVRSKIVKNLEKLSTNKIIKKSIN